MSTNGSGLAANADARRGAARPKHRDPEAAHVGGQIARRPARSVRTPTPARTAAPRDRRRSGRATPTRPDDPPPRPTRRAASTCRSPRAPSPRRHGSWLARAVVDERTPAHDAGPCARGGELGVLQRLAELVDRRRLAHVLGHGRILRGQPHANAHEMRDRAHRPGSRNLHDDMPPSIATQAIHLQVGDELTSDFNENGPPIAQRGGTRGGRHLLRARGARGVPGARVRRQPRRGGRRRPPELKSYFTSRGACMGQVTGEVVAAAFGCFNPKVVVPAVAAGWQITSRDTILEAREQGATAMLQRILGDQPDGLDRVTDLLSRGRRRGAVGRPRDLRRAAVARLPRHPDGRDVACRGPGA